MQQKQGNIPRYTEAPRPPRMGMVPFPFIAVAIVGAFASWIPLAYFARARATLSKEPRVSLIQDMGIQPKFREQQSNPLFADGRADRPEIVGTVARGRLDADDHMYRGYEFTNEIDPKTKKPVVKFFDGFPSGIKVDAKLLNRGQERFNIYCSACHGYDGYGHGVVNERGLELQSEEKGAWVAAANLTIEPAKSRAAGHIYNTINMGIRNMPGYGPQIPVEDRWAIVAYVKALQLSQDVATSLVSPEVIKQSEASGTAK